MVFILRLSGHRNRLSSDHHRGGPAHYLRRGYFFIFGGASIAVGCSAMLVELFQCVTFGGEMFRWSLYPVGVLSSLGLLWFWPVSSGPWRRHGKRIFI